ncbi:MAG: DUF1893 domain-containing protein [Defluviitaleaceae bacterium]|nr:DUF1893 domain-containing protein [Defluviitaleaceae bacterium]
MQQLEGTKRLVVAGMFVAVGILLPYFTAHMFGVPGTVLLPMHIPVFLIGLLCGAKFGLIAGMMIPILSSVLTGMPPTFPMLPIMIGELGMYGFMSGLVFGKINRLALHKTIKIYIALVIAMVAGRMVYGVIFGILFFTAAEPLRALSVPGAIVTGWPGLLIQLTLIPLIVYAVFRETRPSSVDGAKESFAPKSLEEAKAYIKSGEYTCVVMHNGEVTYKTSGIGIKPIMHLFENERETLKDAQVADKVIGKAAAMMLTLAGVKYVYGEIMSVSGRDFLSSRGIPTGYGQCVDAISNRKKDGICPLEQSVLAVDSPEEAYPILKATIAQLMHQKKPHTS